jgi:hypothetical protein
MVFQDFRHFFGSAMPSRIIVAKSDANLATASAAWSGFVAVASFVMLCVLSVCEWRIE